ncbi:acyl-CoA thioesterase [Calidifontibacillus oryziterrae]|uniref:acyl-CoA thioesterase n=1 Tax=Calidifontibacillus oryziterrae TaxID=1191699 RepID=UPI0002F351F4|nr:thioesterase family protein [Calidifontibacillus oryziterrae]
MHVTEVKVDVRYAETDQMGVVYHANYLVWFEIGRTNLIKELGFDYAEMEKGGIVSPVLDANISFKKPLHFGEEALIRTWIDSYDGFRSVYGYEILNPEGEIAVTGQTHHICVDKETFRPIRFKKHFPDWHEAYEKEKRQID